MQTSNVTIKVMTLTRTGEVRCKDVRYVEPVRASAHVAVVKS